MTDQTAMHSNDANDAGIRRRNLFRAAGAGAAILGGGTLLDACSSGLKGSGSGGGANSKEITIGWVHPLTGSLSGFGAPDEWIWQQVSRTPQFKKGIKIGGKTYTFTLKSYDSQSSATLAGTLAKQAIQNDNVDILFADSTPETVNEVASQAEALGTPLVCANIPWESWYGNLGGNPVKPTFKPKYAVMYFLGAEHLAKCFIPMWSKIGAKYGSDHTVAAAFPNDSDGNAFRSVFPPILKKAGYTMALSSPYPDGTTNYSSMISQFKGAKADFFTNAPLPPDFATMWKQCVQQGYKPKLATVAKVLLFPTDAYAMGNLANNIVTDAWWVPSLPWHSSLTGQSCQQMADLFTSDGHGQPNSNISNYTLFEIAFKAFSQVNNPHDHDEVAAALYKVRLPEALAGPIDYTSTNPKTNPAPGVAITPPVGIQWQKGTKYQLEAKVVDNTLLPQARLTGDLKPTFA
ncbi:MAG: ABC transporter substrate-binding protein [Nocardiopsaceae bacterium]|nr:ABC transporter substrate-binding protein [Nocardiopsaceae bacterium]